MNIATLTDKELFELCQEYGNKARFWLQKFAGLLPEVYRRKLYFQKGFGSIFEFAAKLAGMSEEQVRRVLNLEKKFVVMPVLKAMLINGEVSVNKLAKVASIATPENQAVLANQVKLLGYRALETLARDEKFEKSVRANTNPSQSFEDAIGLDQSVKQKLLELRRKGIDINAFILEAIEKREQDIAQEKERLAAEMKPTKSRYIPVETRNLLKQEYGEKCSIDSCEKEADVIHHIQRFGLSNNNNPKYLAPLCREHHEIAHTIDVKFHEIVSHLT